MAQYAHLSTPDPEFAALVGKVPPLDLKTDDIPALQERWIQYGQPAWKAAYLKRLRPDAKYRVQEHKVAVEGGEINVRAVIPVTENKDETFPLVVWYHGGGWVLGNLDQQDYFLRALTVDLNVTTLNVEYRTAPQHPFPTFQNDSYAALKWAAAHPDLLSASLNKGFIVGGQSAGGNISAVLALRARDDPDFHDTPLTGQFLCIPATLHMDAHDGQYKHELLSYEQNKNAPGLDKAAMRMFYDCLNAPPTDPHMSPVLAASHTNLPPAVFQICGLDPLRDEAFLYERLLREAGNKTKVEVYPGVPHGFRTTFATIKQADKWEDDTRAGITWLLSEGKARLQ